MQTPTSGSSVVVPIVRTASTTPKVEARAEDRPVVTATAGPLHQSTTVVHQSTQTLATVTQVLTAPPLPTSPPPQRPTGAASTIELVRPGLTAPSLGDPSGAVTLHIKASPKEAPQEVPHNAKTATDKQQISGAGAIGPFDAAHLPPEPHTLTDPFDEVPADREQGLLFHELTGPDRPAGATGTRRAKSGTLHNSPSHTCAVTIRETKAHEVHQYATMPRAAHAPQHSVSPAAAPLEGTPIHDPQATLDPFILHPHEFETPHNCRYMKDAARLEGQIDNYQAMLERQRPSGCNVIAWSALALLSAAGTTAALVANSGPFQQLRDDYDLPAEQVWWAGMGTAAIFGTALTKAVENFTAWRR